MVVMSVVAVMILTVAVLVIMVVSGLLFEPVFQFLSGSRETPRGRGWLRRTGDFHIAAADSASAFLAHKINSGLTTKYTKHTKPSPEKSGGVRRISRRVPLLLRLVFQTQPRPADILQLFILSCHFVRFVVVDASS